MDSDVKARDLTPPFYLSHGIVDVVIVDPRILEVIHHQATGVTTHTSPVVLDLASGCRVTV